MLQLEGCTTDFFVSESSLNRTIADMTSQSEENEVYVQMSRDPEERTVQPFEHA